MGEWWQSQAYRDRETAGEVVTPGLIDWGGIVNAFNAPYNERVGRLPIGPAPGGGHKGDVYAITGVSHPGPVNAKQDRYGTSTPDRVSAMESGQWPQAPMTPQQHLAFRDTRGIPLPRGGTGPEGYRLASGTDGYDIQAKPGPQAPSLPNPLPYGMKSFTGTGPTPAGYRPGMRFATTPRAPDDGVIDLNLEGLSDRGAQGMADSQGQPVRNNGKTYYPGGKAPTNASNVHDVKYINGRPYAMDPKRGPVMLGSGPSGLFGMLFGNSAGGLFGGNKASPSAAGLVPHLGAVPTPSAPAPTYTTTPFQEDRFQTTTGAQMPSSMNNSRWTTGY